jgi:hypothetical protein
MLPVAGSQNDVGIMTGILRHRAMGMTFSFGARNRTRTGTLLSDAADFLASAAFAAPLAPDAARAGFGVWSTPWPWLLAQR